MSALILAGYIGGSDSMTEIRPATLDKPLKGFHSTINSMVRDGSEVLSTMNVLRENKPLKIYQRELKRLRQPS